MENLLKNVYRCVEMQFGSPICKDPWMQEIGWRRWYKPVLVKDTCNSDEWLAHIALRMVDVGDIFTAKLQFCLVYLSDYLVLKNFLYISYVLDYYL